MRAVQILPGHGFVDHYCSTSSEALLKVVINVIVHLLIIHTPTVCTVQVAEQYGIDEKLFDAHQVAVDGVDVVHEFQSLQHFFIVVEA